MPHISATLMQPLPGQAKDCEPTVVEKESAEGRDIENAVAEHPVTSKPTTDTPRTATSLPDKFADRGMMAFAVRRKIRWKYIRQLSYLAPEAVQRPMLVAMCATLASCFTWLVRQSEKMCIPIWLVVGLVVAVLLPLLPVMYSVLIYLIDSLGLGGFIQRVKTKMQHTYNDSSSKFNISLNQAMAMYVDPFNIRNPDLDQHPFTSHEGGKDWFRLLVKVALDAFSSQYLEKCTEQQVHFCLPLLMLRDEFRFALEQLRQRLNDSNSLAIQALSLALSDKSTVESGYRQQFLETVLGEEKVSCWASHVEFFKKCCDLPCIPQTLEGDELPKDLLSPFTGASGPVEQVVVEKRFSSGHGPVVIKIKYRQIQDAQQHQLCKGDTVEAFVDGGWRHGRIMKVTLDSFNFIDASNKKYTVMPEHIRPWPSRLLLKPDSVDNDMTCFRMFRVFNYLWRHSFIPEDFIPVALDLEVLPAGPNFGFIEFAENSQPASKYDWGKLYTCSDDQMRVFLRTAAGSIIAGHVLGVGDRHQDNLMLRETELPNLGTCIQFFQLDFKHCLGMRARIDANSIALPNKMKEVLENITAQDSLRRGTDIANSFSCNKLEVDEHAKHDRFSELVAMCGMAFRVLRRSSGLIMGLVRILNRDAELERTWEKHLMTSLCYQMDEDRAVQHVCDRVRHSVRSLAKLVKDISHQ